MNSSPPPSRPRPMGFTLVELLVVIGIIAALASLLLVAGAAALRAAREGAIKTECTQISDGFTKYTQDVSGGSYPPNLTIPAASNAELENDFKRHFNKAFPKHREPAGLINLLATGVNNGDYEVFNSPVETGINSYEAVVFWLGGFSDDPKFPLSGPGGPSFNTNDIEDWGARNKIFDFAQERLGPLETDKTFAGRYITYPDPRDSSGSTIRRMNLWMYIPNSKVTLPYMYFDASRKPKYPVLFDNVSPIVALKTGSPALQFGNLRLANEGRCQILAAGLDDAWGDFSNEGMIVDWSETDPTTTYNGIVYPDGPFTGDLADTITNFTTNRTLEDSQP